MSVITQIELEASTPRKRKAEPSPGLFCKRIKKRKKKLAREQEFLYLLLAKGRL